MSTQRFTPEFKQEAVRQVVDRGYSAAPRSRRVPRRASRPWCPSRRAPAPGPRAVSARLTLSTLRRMTSISAQPASGLFAA